MATNVHQKRIHIFENLYGLTDDEQEKVKLLIKSFDPDNAIGEEDEDGEYTFDVRLLPDHVVDLIYDGFIRKIKRKREETPKEMEEQNKEHPRKKRKVKAKFTITINVIDCSKKHEDGGLPYECSICKKRFHDKSNLKKHVRVHTEEKPFECKVCLKRFRHSQSLKEHMNIHEKKKPYVCNICDKAFANKSNLSRHKRTHSKVKPYVCDDCGKEFSQSSNLKTHLRNIHKKIVTKVHKRK